jgi:hypothetical protein
LRVFSPFVSAVAVNPPQWKATIDFKWIRDNKDTVAANIQNRNSNANLELVLELYEKFLNLQKVGPFVNYILFQLIISVPAVIFLLSEFIYHLHLHCFVGF